MNSFSARTVARDLTGLIGIVLLILQGLLVLGQQQSDSLFAPSQSTTTITTTQVKYMDQHKRHRRQQEIRSYQYWTAESIHETLHEWQERYPHFVTLTSAQQEWNFPTAGNDADCPFEDRPGCQNWILRLEDSQQKESLPSMPQLFLSGALHGDEQVGPSVVMEVAELLLEAAHCESLPQGHFPNGTALTEEQIQDSIKAAKECRERLSHEKAMYPVHRKWLARLLSTRRIWIIPAANSLGFYRGTRLEGQSDPNRDFPYDLKEGNEACYETLAARTMGKLLSEHMMQIGVTFHGGMEAVAYEWGAPSHTEVAPDATSQSQISDLYARYAGAISAESPKYQTGTMNEIVYSVEGGMEDWSYAGSWDRGLVQKKCETTSYGGFDAQPEPNDYSLRIFTALVETSNDKKPDARFLGSNQDLWTPKGGGNGHISRNVRLSLAMIDIVEPYISILSINNLEIWDDIVPLSPRTGESCGVTKRVVVPVNSPNVVIRWMVGGGITVDHTSLLYGNMVEMQRAPFACASAQVTQAQIDAFLKEHSDIRRTPSERGQTRWHEEISFPNSHEEALHPLETIFSAEIDVTGYAEGEEVVVYALARVDQDWSQQGDATMQPQTHLVHARTDPTWSYESSDGNQFIQGHLDWISIPLTVEMGPADSELSEKSVRNPFDEWKPPPENLELSAGAIATFTLTLVVIIFAVHWYTTRDRGEGTEERNMGRLVWLRKRLGYASPPTGPGPFEGPKKDLELPANSNNESRQLV